MSDWTHITGTISLPAKSRISLQKFSDSYLGEDNYCRFEQTVIENFRYYKVAIALPWGGFGMCRTIEKMLEDLRNTEPNVRISLVFTTDLY